MDPKRKKIYIILIVVCFGLSAAILGWNFFGSSTAAPIPLAPLQGGGTNVVPIGGVNLPPATDNSAATFAGGGFRAPATFPAINTFDTKAIDSTDFKNLMDYTPLSTTGQIGRDNPFKNY